MRDQIAHIIMVYSWRTETMQDLQDPTQAYPLVDRILERTEAIRWCSVHCRSVSDSRATACLSGGKVACEIEVRYMLRSGPPPMFVFDDADVEMVQRSIQSSVGILLPVSTIRASLEQLQR